jgi:hypothetical protein
MRNRSRNRSKRGGELTPEEKEKLGLRCTFCSEDKKKFKVYMDDSNKLYLKLLQNLSEEKAAELFHDLNDNEKKIFVQCLINNNRSLWETNTDMAAVKEQIDAENTEKRIMADAVNNSKAEWGFKPSNPQNYSSVLKAQNSELSTHAPTDAASRPTSLSDAVVHKETPLGPGEFFTPKPRASHGGGKSRRRRRACRTNKKSRKSHKVRKSHRRKHRAVRR